MIIINVVLIGMPFSGKSTVGQRLSNILGYSLIDTDIHISTSERLSISEIFRLKGEDYFRKCEEKLLLELIERNINDVVISTGGGTPVFYNSFEKLISLGKVIYLYSSLEIIIRRASENTERPLLMGDYISKLKLLYKERRYIYNRAQYKINTDGLPVEEICLNIIKLLEIEKINNNNCK